MMIKGFLQAQSTMGGDLRAKQFVFSKLSFWTDTNCIMPSDHYSGVPIASFLFLFKKE